MTQSTDTLPTTLTARALWNISNLMLNNRVTITAEIEPSPGSSWLALVDVDVFAYPVERDELIAALASPTAREWLGDSGVRYREWRGELLTMTIRVIEALPGPLATEPVPESGPSGDEPLTCLGAPAGYLADCNLPGPHGPHPLDQEPPSTTGQLVADGPEPWAVHYELDPVPPLRPAVPAVGVARATDGRDTVAEAYGRYARALFAMQHETVTFVDEFHLVAAVEAWPGRHMLTQADIGQLVAEHRTEMGSTMGTGNVADDDEESLVFADESEPDEQCEDGPVEEPGEMLQGSADTGRRPYIEQGRGSWIFRRRATRRGSAGRHSWPASEAL